jgi:hypothetical protein
MKKNGIILVITLVLALAALALYLTNRRGTIKKELKDFAVKDTGSVDRIFLADRRGRKILLERNPDNTWTLNKKYKARPDGVKTLLYTMYNLDVKSPVAKAAHNTIIKQLAASGVKVEIYLKGKLEKTYYVGGTTQDQLGTFMLLEDSSTPFVMHIPGFNGFLNTRYQTDELGWRDKSIFRYGQEDITGITVINHGKPASSFRIEKENNEYVLRDTAGRALGGDPLKVKSYVASYKNVHAEDIIADSPDSVLRTKPAFTLEVTDRNKKVKTLRLYHKPNHAGHIDEKGRLYPHDMERMYAFTDGDFLMVQLYVFGRLLKERKELLQDPS